MRPISKDKGFTLIELMVVVAIIGILATVAAGEFMSYQAKSKQSEAKINLEAIAKMAETYMAEHNTYVATLDQLGWQPNMTTRYRYWYNHTTNLANPTHPDLGVDYSDPGSAADPSGFTEYAVGNIDSDTDHDVWYYTSDRVLKNSHSDLH